MGGRVCQDILSGILENIDTVVLFNICRDIITETELCVETNCVLQMIGDSKLLGLEDSARVRLVTKSLEDEEANKKIKRMKKRNIQELEWAVRKNEMKFKEMVENMSRMAVGDRVEERINSLGLWDKVEVETIVMITFISIQ